ncbi:MAG: MalY/PatB family protein [Coriobacteriaceae bacterium]
MGHDSIAADAAGAISGGSLGPVDAVVREGFDIIPMWVADMGFATAPSVLRAMRERLEHPCFGYFEYPQEYYDRIAWWHERRNGVVGLKPENIGYENGVLGGVANALAVVCSRGDKVLVHAPTYTGFTNTLKNAGYDLVTSWLRRDAEGVWRMDYEDMERKLATREVHAAILCSPHNPTGRVWERWELERAMGLFRKYDVYVISDEIWSDIVLGGSVHIPTQSVSDDARMRTVALYAPSKTFNIAGLIGSYRVVYNPWLQARLAKQASLSHYNMQNVLSMHALLGAYSDEGAAWSTSCEVLGRNARITQVLEGSLVSILHDRRGRTCSSWIATVGAPLMAWTTSCCAPASRSVCCGKTGAFGGDKTIRINQRCRLRAYARHWSPGRLRICEIGEACRRCD